MIVRLPQYQSDFHGRSFVFIHIPRTAGTAITLALAQQYPDAIVSLFGNKHADALRSCDYFRSGSEWLSAFRFSMIRSPWEIIASDYRHTLAAAMAATPASRLECTSEWWLRMQRVRGYAGFTEFVRLEWLCEHSLLRPGGFWRSWCQGPEGEDLGIVPYRFDQLSDAWAQIRGALGAGDLPLPAPTPTPQIETTWTPALVDAVEERCQGDVTRFGFPLPPVLMSHSPQEHSHAT